MYEKKRSFHILLSSAFWHEFSSLIYNSLIESTFFNQNVLRKTNRTELRRPRFLFTSKRIFNWSIVYLGNDSLLRQLLDYGCNSKLKKALFFLGLIEINLELLLCNYHAVNKTFRNNKFKKTRNYVNTSVQIQPRTKKTFHCQMI